jgi:hypothetical protein
MTMAGQPTGKEAVAVASSMETMKGNTRTDWHCPTCGVTLTTFVVLTDPPSHPCPKKAMRHINLQPKKEEPNE